MPTLVQSKVSQAIDIMKELDIDLWLTFVRETSAFADPVLPLIYGADLTWQSALILTQAGEKIAVVGRFEAETARRTDAYDEVILYDEAFSPALIDILTRLKPTTIGINYSLDDPVADGLSYGMYQMLMGILKDTPYSECTVSAEVKIHPIRNAQYLQKY
jgi:hypothetical protein